jgi:hypothetical protein
MKSFAENTELNEIDTTGGKLRTGENNFFPNTTERYRKLFRHYPSHCPIRNQYLFTHRDQDSTGN